MKKIQAAYSTAGSVPVQPTMVIVRLAVDIICRLCPNTWLRCDMGSNAKQSKLLHAANDHCPRPSNY